MADFKSTTDYADKEWIERIGQVEHLDREASLTEIIAVAAIAATAVFIPFAAWWVL